MRAVADRLAAFVGGLTTVPDAPARGPAAERPPTKTKTTFGDSAAEMVDGDAPPRKRGSMTLVVAAVLGLGAGGIAVSRLRATPSASAGAAPIAAEPPPPAAVPAAVAPAAAPAPSPAAAALAVPAPSPPAAPAPKEEGAPARKKGHHHGVEVASAALPAPAAASVPAAASAPPPETLAAAPTDFAGTWEGPWEDAEHHQNGRLYLQVAGGGASGWLSNTTAGRSYRIVGRAERPGEYLLACQCPANQAFKARVVLHPTEGGELHGRVSLSAATGVFGQSHVVLRHSAAR
jgi:hypothetical protein